MPNRLIVAAVAGAALIALPVGAATVKAMTMSDNGRVLHTTEVLKSGKHLETVRCSDFNQLDASFKPQAITYAANYGPMGKPHPTYTVSGVERIVPVVVSSCNAQPGDTLLSHVGVAMKQKR